MGVAIGAISLTYFSGFFATVDPDNREIITLLRRDGTILVQHPQALDSVGHSLSSGSQWYNVVSAGGGLYEGLGLITGSARSTSVQPVRDISLVIDIGTDTAIALAGWQRQTVFIGMGSAVAVVTLIGLFQLLREKIVDAGWPSRILVEAV